MAPRAENREGYPRRSRFRGSIAGPWRSLSTLRGVGLPTAARKTRFRLLARLCRVGLATHRVTTKGFNNGLASFPPFPSFPGAISEAFRTFQSHERKVYLYPPCLTHLLAFSPSQMGEVSGVAFSKRLRPKALCPSPVRTAWNGHVQFANGVIGWATRLRA